MKGKLRFKLIQIYTSVVNSISFLPTLICLFYFFLVITFLIMHSLGMDYKLKESIPFFEIQGAETARAVITSMLTGLISLSVFSFSTVMVVINQASSNYSPKVIEGLINNRSNQYILGVYIGSILYLLIVLLQVADYDEYNIPHLAILFGILTSMYCLVLFVQFIHSISTSVKISSIIERIYTSTKKQIEDKKNVNNINFIIKMEIGEWFPYSLPKSGYFQRIMLNNLKKITAENNLVLKMGISIGTYYVQNTPLFYLNLSIDNEDLMEKLKNAFIFHTGENIHDTSFYGFRQLREIAVKALSPGINDPGVAILCLEHLTDLFIIQIKNPQVNSIYDDKGNLRVILKLHTMEELLNTCLLPIYFYGKKDVIVLGKMIDLIRDVAYNDCCREYLLLLNHHAGNIIEEAPKQITNKLDQEYFEEKVNSLNLMLNNYFRLSPLNWKENNN